MPGLGPEPWKSWMKERDSGPRTDTTFFSSNGNSRIKKSENKVMWRKDYRIL